MYIIFCHLYVFKGKSKVDSPGIRICLSNRANAVFYKEFVFFLFIFHFFTLDIKTLKTSLIFIKIITVILTDLLNTLPPDMDKKRVKILNLLI